ncbi:MAG: ATP-binding cassette domain-containing protein [Pseudomonadota bacterium]
MSPPEGRAVLRVADLTVRARGRERPVLDRVSLTVVAGETLGIVGESGSGKTTLARCVIRQEAPLALAGGSIRLLGTELSGLSQRAMRPLRGRRVAMVEQDPIGAFDPLFTVYDQIAEFVAVHRGAVAAAAGVSPDDALAKTFQRIEAFGVPGAARAARAWPHQWSRGMLQRALFALASAPAPALMILDEPTAALDAPVADRLVADIRRLARAEGVATLLITHDLGLAATACDRILVLRDGQMVETGPTGALLGAPRTDYARALVESAAW